MAADPKLNLIIGVVDKASGPLGKISGALGGIAKIGGAAFLGGAIAGVGALGAALVSGIGDAREARLIFAQTEAVIASTGGAAGFTADQISDMAGSLSAASGMSLFGDDDIQRGQNMLLTFTNIKETLPDATQVMLDMATAMGTDADASAIQLGKALNDPIEGISALTRVGVTFTAEQKEQIKTMMQAGDVAGAQKIILAELNKEFGGSAAAAAAADGGFAQFKDSMGELAESVGGRVTPVLRDLLAWLNSPDVQTAIISFVDSLVNGVESVVLAIPPLIEGFNSFLAAMQPVIGFVQNNLTSILAGLAAMLITIVVPAFVTWATAAGTAAVATITALAPVIAPIAAIGIAVGLLVAAWTNDWGGMRTTLTSWWEVIRPIVETVRDWIEVKLTAAMAALQKAWDVAWPIIQKAVAAVYDFLKDNVWPWIVTAFNTMKDDVLPALSEGFSIAWTAISKAVTTVYNVFKDEVWPWLQTALDNIGKWITTAKNTWNEAWGLIAGAVTTAKNTISDVITTIKNIVQGAIDQINALIRLINAIPGVNIPTIPTAPTGGGGGGSGFGGRSVGAFSPLGGIAGHPGGSVTSSVINIDARGSSDPRGVAVNVERGLRQAGIRGELRLRTT